MIDINDGLIKIQDFIRKRPVLIVGSGLSISMGLPGMDELLDYLKNKIPTLCNDEQIEEWENCLELIEKYGFEEGLGKLTISNILLEYIIKETAHFVGERDRIFATNIPLMTLEDFPFAKLLDHFVKSLIPLNPEMTVITPNYDLLVEYACDMINVTCCNGFYGSQFQSFNQELFKKGSFRQFRIYEKTKPKIEYRKIPTIKLLKPHGSLNWINIDDNVFQTSVNCSGKKIIITPGDTKYKSSLTNVIMNAHRELANETISTSNSVLIVGYGFNDDHLQTVLCDKIKAGLDCLVITKSLSTKARELIDDYKNIIALEKDKNSLTGTRWYIDGNTGLWDEPLWELNQFVKRVTN